MKCKTDVNETHTEMMKGNPALGLAVLEEATELLKDGDADAARILLRNVVNATLGFEELAEKTGKNSKSLHRMLSAGGSPTMDNVSLIFKVLRASLESTPKVAAKAACPMHTQPRHAQSRGGVFLCPAISFTTKRDS